MEYLSEIIAAIVSGGASWFTVWKSQKPKWIGQGKQEGIGEGKRQGRRRRRLRRHHRGLVATKRQPVRKRKTAEEATVDFNVRHQREHNTPKDSQKNGPATEGVTGPR
jgi:hypothetical protein